MKKTITSIVFRLLLIVSAIFSISSCGNHHVLLKAPDLQDDTPGIITGFYRVQVQEDGDNGSSVDSAFLGNMIYLYKDQFFVEESFFTGIKGTFLPNNFISSKRVDGRTEYYWLEADNEDYSGRIEIISAENRIIHLAVTNPSGQKEFVRLDYLARKIWAPEVKTTTIAHRGLCYQPPSNFEGIYPANTIPGFENALRAGYDGFELDVRLTKDKRFIVSHDEDLRVATTVRGAVAEKKLAEFKDILVVQSAPIPENRSSARPAYIAAPMSSLKDILDEFIDDERLQTIVVDIKPDKEEDILHAATQDFSGLREDQQKKILFLTRSEGVARGLKELAPAADIAKEGPTGVEPTKPDKWADFLPEAAGKERLSHNTISFGSNWVLTFNSDEASRETLRKVDSISTEHGYKQCHWTYAKDWRINFLRKNEFFPDYLLLDVPYYKIGLQQLRYADGKNLQLKTDKRPLIELDRYPAYKKMLDKHVKDFWFKSRQLYEIKYGVGTPLHSDFNSAFAPVGIFELSVGRSMIDKFSETSVEMNNRFLFFSSLGTSLAPDKGAEQEISTESFRFGIGANIGTGYTDGKDFSFTPYVGQALVWTKLNEYDSIEGLEEEKISADSSTLELFRGAFRFGDRAIYGVKMELLSSLQLSASFETAVVYPRFLFGQWVASFGLAQAGYALVGYLADDFVNQNPVFGPLLNFVVKSAYLYGYYYLRNEDTNWPFESDTPLRYESFSLGVGFAF